MTRHTLTARLLRLTAILLALAPLTGAATTTCADYFKPEDHGDCIGRNCGPQNFSPGQTPTHCGTKNARDVQPTPMNPCMLGPGTPGCQHFDVPIAAALKSVTANKPPIQTQSTETHRTAPTKTTLAAHKLPSADTASLAPESHLNVRGEGLAQSYFNTNEQSSEEKMHWAKAGALADVYKRSLPSSLQTDPKKAANVLDNPILLRNERIEKRPVPAINADGEVQDDARDQTQTPVARDTNSDDVVERRNDPKDHQHMPPSPQDPHPPHGSHPPPAHSLTDRSPYQMITDEELKETQLAKEVEEAEADFVMTQTEGLEVLPTQLQEGVA